MTDTTTRTTLLAGIDAAANRAHSAVDALHEVVEEARRDAPHLLGVFEKAFCDMDAALTSLLPGGEAAAQGGLVQA